MPAPSQELITAAKNYADSYVFDPDKKRWLDEFHNNKINSALHCSITPEFLTQSLVKEFQCFFPQRKIIGMFLLMKNTKDVPACLPPHCDRSRAFGINYFVTLGGNNVRTVFYNRVESIVGVATNVSYTEITPVEEYVAEQGWYGYKVNRCHSVENIEHTRLCIAIRLIRSESDNDMDFEYTLEDFERDYPHLCIYN